MDIQNNQTAMVANNATSSVHNKNLTDAEISNLDISELANVKDSWYIDKQFFTRSGAGFDLNIEPTNYYKGHIKDYTMVKCTKNNKDFFYINITCVVLTESGIFSFDHNMPVSFYNNSSLTRLLYELDFNVDNLQSFDFDDLKNKLVWVALDYSGPNGIVITDIKNR